MIYPYLLLSTITVFQLLFWSTRGPHLHKGIALLLWGMEQFFSATHFASAWHWRSGLRHGLKLLRQGEKHTIHYYYKILSSETFFFFSRYFFSFFFSAPFSFSLVLTCQQDTGPLSAIDTVFSCGIAKRIAKVLSSFCLSVHNRKWRVFLGFSNKAHRAPGYIEIAGCTLESLCTFIISLVRGLPWVVKICFPFLKSLAN